VWLFGFGRSDGDMRSRFIAEITIFASLYLTLGFVLQSVAFGVIQVRVADALYPLIAVFGLPCLFGTFLGHLIFNFYGFSVGLALGLGDLASPFLFLIPKYAIYKWKLKAVPLHVLFVTFWVSWLLHTLYGLPFWLCVLTVGIGETIAEIGLGVPLAVAVKRRVEND